MDTLRHRPRAIRRALFSALVVTPALAAASGKVVSYELVGAPVTTQAKYMVAPLVQAPDGLMYGTAQFGGAHGNGSIYRLESDGAVTPLHSYTHPALDGAQPTSALVVGDDGWLYGSTPLGGAAGMGVLFKISTSGEYVVLHEFSADTDGAIGYPSSALVPDGGGHFFGTTGNGVYGSIGNAHASVFTMAPDGTITVLDRFPKENGVQPVSLVRALDGVLYGATQNVQGPPGGTVFSIRPGGLLHTLHTFDCASEGCQPSGALVAGTDNALYGTTSWAPGTAWRMTFKGEFTVIHVFSWDDPLGYQPIGGFSSTEDGLLYGTTSNGGALVGGAVFQMTHRGKGLLLHHFDPYSFQDGRWSHSAPTILPGGVLYGTLPKGGPYRTVGAIYRIQLVQ